MGKGVLMELQIVEKRNILVTKNVVFVVGIAICVLFVAYGFQSKIFTSQSALEAFLGRFGVFAPAIFILFQAIQVIFPILPGGIGCLAGTLIFGPVMGFIYNYIGICSGSIAAFLISKNYGTAIMKSLFCLKLQEKYSHWAKSKKFTKMFAAAIFLPVAPDDFLCYLAGTTAMSLKTFILIIMLGKPLALAVYSFGLDVVFDQLAAWVHLYANVL